MDDMREEMRRIRKLMRTYSELCTIPTFLGRYRYLRIGGTVGEDTYGFDRWVNQRFYKSDEWRNVRNYVIWRDTGDSDYCKDLGCEDHFITNNIIIHHMNPIRLEDIQYATDILLNPEYLISTQLKTHNAIHYGDESLLIEPMLVVERKPNDMCPWRA